VEGQVTEEKGSRSVDKSAVETVLGLMALAARTAPKSFAMDCLEIQILSHDERQRIASKMRAMGENKSSAAKTENKAKALSLDWNSDAETLERADGILLLGIRGTMTPGVNCGGCGFQTCADMSRASRPEGDFPGPFCMYRVLDLGIAVSSAVAVAAHHFLDNRMFQKIGAAAIKLGIMGQCAPILGIGVSCSAKNIFFDRKDKAIAASLAKAE
jgi:uncharacterized ferredoxin-like protein